MNEKKQSESGVQIHEQEGWQFVSVKAQMFNTKQLDQIADVLPLQRLPDILLGNNRLYLAYPEKDFVLEMNPLTALSLGNFQVREKYFKGGECKFDEKEPQPVNLIDVIPKEVQVMQAQFWKKKDTSKIKDFKKLEVISDWTFSTPYKGTAAQLSNYPVGSLPFPTGDAKAGSAKIEPTEEEIPYERLGKDNPILYYDEVHLFEDELDDSGGAKSGVRFRSMKDCFYALVRFYLRVDGVMVRIFDTRIFHSFGENYILREFQYKESTYQELKEDGFKFAPDWSIDPNQADHVLPFLKLKMKCNDKVSF